MIELRVDRWGDKWGNKPQAYWKSAQPFVMNDLASLIHRPKSITQHKLGSRPPHLAIHCYCGSGFTGTKKFTFLEAPPERSIVCLRCEVAAIKAGLQSSADIAGRHVHVGGLKAIKYCCEDL